MSHYEDFVKLLRKRGRAFKPPFPGDPQRSIEFTYRSDTEAAQESEPVRGHVQAFQADAKVDALVANFPDNFHDIDDKLVADVHGWYLYRHLELFAHARSQATRDEYLEWFVMPPRFGGIDLDLSRVDPLSVPFSLERCCWYEEKDPEEVREAVIRTNLVLQGRPLRRFP